MQNIRNYKGSKIQARIKYLRYNLCIPKLYWVSDRTTKFAWRILASEEQPRKDTMLFVKWSTTLVKLRQRSQLPLGGAGSLGEFLTLENTTY